jgi:urate oxidase
MLGSIRRRSKISFFGFYTKKFLKYLFDFVLKSVNASWVNWLKQKYDWTPEQKSKINFIKNDIFWKNYPK